MEQQINKVSLETLAYKYSSEEIASAAFSLKLFRDQLMADRIVDDPEDHLDYHALVESINVQIVDIGTGMHSLTPDVHTAMLTIFFTYTIHVNYISAPDPYNQRPLILGVSTEDLQRHSTVAERVVNASQQSVTFV